MLKQESEEVNLENTVRCKIKIIRKPVFAILFYNFFDNKTNELIRLEAKHLQFSQAKLMTGIDKTFRDNKSVDYDEIYSTKEQKNKSPLISAIQKKFSDSGFVDILASSPYPLSEILAIDSFETSVSTYSENQRYKWHVDRFDASTRLISLVYYFFKEPKKFTGGNLGLTSSPVSKGNTIEELNENYLEVKPINNLAVVFGSNTPHCVLPSNVENEEYIRYSANIWIGKK